MGAKGSCSSYPVAPWREISGRARGAIGCFSAWWGARASSRRRSNGTPEVSFHLSVANGDRRIWHRAAPLTGACGRLPGFVGPVPPPLSMSDSRFGCQGRVFGRSDRRQPAGLPQPDARARWKRRPARTRRSQRFNIAAAFRSHSRRVGCGPPAPAIRSRRRTNGPWHHTSRPACRSPALCLPSPASRR